MRRREPTPAEVLGICLSLAQEVQRGLPPAPRRRGRPSTYPPPRHLALLLFRAFYHLPYRRTVAWAKALQAYARRHLSQHLLSSLLRALRERLESALGEGEGGPFFLLDSTGLPYRRKGTLLRWMRGKEKRRMRSHSRPCLLVRWERRRRLLGVVGLAVGPAYAPDPPLGVEALREGGLKGGVLLADAGFDALEVWEEARRRGLTPHIRLKGGGRGPRSPLRVEGEKGFSPALYRLRGVVEGVFGGIKTRLLGGYLAEMGEETPRKRVFLEALAYNLRVLLSLLLWLLGPRGLGTTPATQAPRLPFAYTYICRTTSRKQACLTPPRGQKPGEEVQREVFLSLGLEGVDWHSCYDKGGEVSPRGERRRKACVCSTCRCAICAHIALWRWTSPPA
ncbi:hypothetical protein HRbin23_00960 [bacterium HR23]|nr:hypothetical protein HRbin23_00960 [bacterium HR23]